MGGDNSHAIGLYFKPGAGAGAEAGAQVDRAPISNMGSICTGTGRGSAGPRAWAWAGAGALEHGGGDQIKVGYVYV